MWLSIVYWRHGIGTINGEKEDWKCLVNILNCTQSSLLNWRTKFLVPIYGNNQQHVFCNSISSHARAIELYIQYHLTIHWQIQDIEKYHIVLIYSVRIISSLPRFLWGSVLYKGLALALNFMSLFCLVLTFLFVFYALVNRQYKYIVGKYIIYLYELALVEICRRAHVLLTLLCCVCLRIVETNTYFAVFFFSVLCTLCCLFPWIAHFWLPLRYSLKAYRLSEFNFFLILKVANIRCFILIAVEIFHNIIRK